MAQRRPTFTTMEDTAHGKTMPKGSPTRRHRGFTIGEPQNMHRIDHGPEYFDGGRPARRQRSNTDTKAHVESRGRPHDNYDGQQHDEQNQPEPPQKMGLRQKIKAAKDAVKETIQMGKETVGFIRELHKQYKELDDRQQETAMHPRTHHGWRPGKRRSSYYYDSD